MSLETAVDEVIKLAAEVRRLKAACKSYRCWDVVLDRASFNRERNLNMTDTKTELLQDNLSLPEGVITLEYPAKMSAASYQYFARWVQIVLDKTKNSITLEGPGGAGGGHTLGSFKGQGGFSSSDSLHGDVIHTTGMGGAL